MPSARARGWRRIAPVALALTTGLTGLAVAAPSSPSVSAACSMSSALGLGSRGVAVQCLQTTLNAQGYNAGPVDGQYGAMTYRAVVAYQRAKGLYVDGIAGRQTATALGIWGSGPTPVTPAPPTTTPTTPSGSNVGCSVSTALRLGSSGSAVRCLQSALSRAGYSPGPADGAFGAMTRAAVMRYQRAKGLVVDGVAGRQTATALGIWGTNASGGSTGSTGNCAPPPGVPAGARQVVVITANGSRADVDLLVYNGSRWTCARMDMAGRVGRNGIRALANRRSGDGTTPAGTFPLGSMTAPDGQTFQFFGNGVNPGVPGTWRQVRSGDCWGATPGTSSYNALVTRRASSCTSPDEYLANFQGAYSRAALIGANMGANRSGDQAGEPPLAAAIFLHRHSYDANGNSRPTSGCVSLNNANLIAVLRALVPGQAYFVIR